MVQLYIFVTYQQLSCFSFLPYPVIYVVVNPVCGLVERKRSEKHLQSSNESIKTKTRQNRPKERNNTQSTSVVFFLPYHVRHPAYGPPTIPSAIKQGTNVNRSHHELSTSQHSGQILRPYYAPAVKEFL